MWHDHKQHFSDFRNYYNTTFWLLLLAVPFQKTKNSLCVYLTIMSFFMFILIKNKPYGMKLISNLKRTSFSLSYLPLQVSPSISPCSTGCCLIWLNVIITQVIQMGRVRPSSVCSLWTWNRFTQRAGLCDRWKNWEQVSEEPDFILIYKHIL